MTPLMNPFFAATVIIIALISQAACAAAEGLTVTVSGFRGGAGQVQVMVWKDAAGFPMQPEKAVAHKSAPVAGNRIDVVFGGLAPGQYAVAAYQDLNGNGKLDRSMMGWPVEPVGASNGASGIFGPPKFADAVFQLKQSGKIELVLK